jgi:hypothetical protein
LLDSSAVEKFQEGRKPELNFGDACGFWSINDSMAKEALDARLDRLRAELADFDHLLLLGDVVLSNGRSISGDDLGLLHKVHTHLEERFSRHLNLLRNPTTARF